MNAPFDPIFVYQRQNVRLAENTYLTKFSTNCPFDQMSYAYFLRPNIIRPNVTDSFISTLQIFLYVNSINATNAKIM